MTYYFKIKINDVELFVNHLLIFSSLLPWVYMIVLSIHPCSAVQFFKIDYCISLFFFSLYE